MIEFIVSINTLKTHFHWSRQHILCYIRDSLTDDYVEIDYYFRDNQPLELQRATYWNSNKFEAVKEASPHVSFFVNTKVTLKDFCTSYNKEFFKEEGGYLHNCSHAVNYALNYFCPLAKHHSFLKSIKHAFCCCLCISSGGCNCFSSKLRTPHEVFKKAEKVKMTAENVIKPAPQEIISDCPEEFLQVNNALK